MNNACLSLDHLLFRRQFLLTSNTVESIPSKWLMRKLGTHDKTWHLYSHPDLEVTVSNNEHFSLLLLGYLLNPLNVELNNQRILNKLNSNTSYEAVIEETHKLNGRFLLFFMDGSSFKVINDASGFRELYYLNENAGIHCGSTPDILNSYIGATKNPDKSVFTFFGSKEYVKNSNTWVGHETIYKNIRKLSPNFQLDILKREVERFWPNQPIRKQNLQEVAAKGSEYLRGCLHCAILRKPVHLGVTAGWDSRVLLAASKDFKDKIFYYVNNNADLDEKHPDIIIPQKLSHKLGFQLHVLNIDQGFDNKTFKNIYYMNNFRANDSLFSVFHHGFLNNYDNTVTVSGNLAEGSARKYYNAPCKPNKFTGRQISRVVGFDDNPYAIRMIDRWLEEAGEVCSEFNINIMDLYQIEHEACNWCSHTASEQDIIREEIRPFNSRYLISMFWSLDDKNRFLYNPKIYRRMIAILWKESLVLPVNPSLKSILYIILGWMRLDQLILKVKVAIKYITRGY